jgi:hypothetical protein
MPAGIVGSAPAPGHRLKVGQGARAPDCPRMTNNDISRIRTVNDYLASYHHSRLSGTEIAGSL